MLENVRIVGVVILGAQEKRIDDGNWERGNNNIYGKAGLARDRMLKRSAVRDEPNAHESRIVGI